MLKGKTESGFEFELEEDVLDDYELLEALRKTDKEGAQEAIDVVNILLGEEQKERLKEHVRNEKGKVSAERLLGEVGEIFAFLNGGKN